MKKQVKKIIICLLLTICCLCGALIGATNNVLYAVSNATKYTNVLYDLQTDENFDASEYVVDNTDYSLQVIQIAESNEKELFVYTYQPYTLDNNLKATSINISQGIDENLHYRNYTLTLLNSNGVFHKYKVDNFRFEDTATRYYDISSIFRKWYAEIDESPNNDNTISEVAYEVSKLYIVSTENNLITYQCLETETVLITDKYVDSFRYWDGWYVIMHEKVDRHFVAFSTDYDIDRLFEVDLIFTTKDYTATNVEILPFDLWSWEVSRTYQSEVEHSITIDYSQKYDMSAHGIFGRSYEWDRIETADDFLEHNNNISQNTIDEVSDKQYVLSFYETYWVKVETTPLSYVNGTDIYDLSIMRLKFEVDGVVYNLGVVDNKQSGDGIPSNYNQHIFGLTSNVLKTILSILLLILLLIILAPFLPQILNFFVWLFKGIWELITTPFKALKKNKKKKKKGGGKK